MSEEATTGSATTVAWIAAGANVGVRTAGLAAVEAALRETGLQVVASPRLLTRAVGVTAQPDFLNEVLRVESPVALSPEAWLGLCHEAETAAGRRPTYRWGPRRADADLLLLGPDGGLRVTTPELTVPHAELGNRPFFCALLAVLEPSLRHPDGWLFSARAGTWTAFVERSNAAAPGN